MSPRLANLPFSKPSLRARYPTPRAICKCDCLKARKLTEPCNPSRQVFASGLAGLKASSHWWQFVLCSKTALPYVLASARRKKPRNGLIECTAVAAIAMPRPSRVRASSATVITTLVGIRRFCQAEFNGLHFERKRGVARATHAYDRVEGQRCR